MRRTETDAERNLWSRLRNARLGTKFRRQQPVGSYVVDFISFEKRLVVEIDGGQHNEPQAIESDEERTSFLESQGFRVMRFWDNEVLQNMQGVLANILKSLD